MRRTRAAALRRGRLGLLAGLLVAWAPPSCEAEVKLADPVAADDLRQRHLVHLERSSCVSCLPRWTIQQCDFLELLRKPGSGVDGARCATLRPQGGGRGLLTGTRTDAIERVKEAAPKLESSVDSALMLYAFGTDLMRMAHPDLWVLGQEVQTRALDALSEQRPDARWPAELLHVAEAGVPPVRLADALIAHELADFEPITTVELEGLTRASTLSVQAIRANMREREQVMTELASHMDTGVDVFDTWSYGENIRHRAIKLALHKAIAAKNGRRACSVTALEDLVPKHIAHVPNGWSFDADTCAPTAAQPPPMRVAGI